MMLVSAILSFAFSKTVLDYESFAAIEKKIVLKQETARLQTWYKSDAYNIDSSLEAVPPPAIINRWGITVLESKRIDCGSSVKGHKYVIVLPGSNGVETSLNAETGVVTEGKYDTLSVVDGCDIQKKLILQSKKNAADLASKLENYFKGMALQEQYAATKNYFITATCGGWGNIPCINDGRSNANALSAQLGISELDYTDAYGHTMHFDNYSSNISALTPPFSSRVGFSVPWGNNEWITAIGKN